MEHTGLGQRLLRLGDRFGLLGIQFALLGVQPLDQLRDQPFEPVQPRLDILVLCGGRHRRKAGPGKKSCADEFPDCAATHVCLPQILSGG